MTMAIVVMVVVIVVVGGAGFAALSAVSGSGNKTISTCSPPNSPACLSTSGLTDVVLSVPYGAGFGQAVATTTQGTSIPATVAVSGGEAVTTYTIYWGDGSNYSGSNPTSNHIYSTMGWYVISAQALVGSTWHTGPKSLYPIDVTPNYQTSSSGFYPTIQTTFTNGSTASTQFGWLSGSGSVSVSAKYTSQLHGHGLHRQGPDARFDGRGRSRASSPRRPAWRRPTRSAPRVSTTSPWSERSPHRPGRSTRTTPGRSMSLPPGSLRAAELRGQHRPTGEEPAHWADHLPGGRPGRRHF